MRVLHIITQFDRIYGAQKHVIESVNNHLLNGHSCKIITGKKGIASLLVEQKGIDVIEISSIENSYNTINDFKAIKLICQQIDAYKADLVISHSTKAGILSRIACYIKKQPNIFTVHGWAFENGAPFLQKMAGRLIEWMIKPISDSYFCVSKYTANFGKQVLGINEKKLFVCPNLHAQQIIPTTDFKLHHNVLMVAEFRKQKDHLTALKAINKIVLEKSIPHLHFTFVGDGANRSAIEHFIHKHQLEQYVTLAGETDNMPAQYQHCDIVILPTFYEGLPVCLIEALQFGKLAIATNVGGVGEIIYEGVNGHLIAMNDYYALAQLITQCYQNNTIEAMCNNSRKIYNEHYEYQKVSAIMNQILQLAINNSIFNKK